MKSGSVVFGFGHLVEPPSHYRGHQSSAANLTLDPNNLTDCASKCKKLQGDELFSGAIALLLRLRPHTLRYWALCGGARHFAIACATDKHIGADESC